MAEATDSTGGRLHHPNFRSIEGTILYRSSRLDNLAQDQIDALHGLGVKAIIDMRSPSSWENNGKPQPNLIDIYYTPLLVTRSRRGTFEKANLFTDAELDAVSPAPDTPRGCYGHRYYLNVIDVEFGVGIAREAPWYRQVQLVGYGIGYLFGNMAVTKKLPEWCLHKPGEIMLLSVYKGIINYCGGRLANAFRLLLELERQPVVISCMQGKDRTGIVAAFLQHICDQDKEAILRGYEKTKEASEALMPEMLEMAARNGFDETFTTCEPETLAALLTYIDERYGGMSEYLRKIGINADDHNRLKKNVQSDED